MLVVRFCILVGYSFNTSRHFTNVHVCLGMVFIIVFCYMCIILIFLTLNYIVIFLNYVSHNIKMEILFFKLCGGIKDLM